MSASSRFAVAVHILALLETNANQALSSSSIAASVNTNPVVIRRILGRLNKAGLVHTEYGADGGTRLARSAHEITLNDIYRATENCRILPLHASSPNQDCRCGRTIQPVLSTIFSNAEAAMQQVLANKSLAEVVREMQAEAKPQACS
ncbi:Rrf2 family transcriptional regulator [Herpetosiphon giganteus]|uniref:Rrf2 family transcriptional regulator n=1 Tax=Herpetosiphon giganteus TaxID=2029754 RepID=UPI00195E323F|nr:Rrf2 family transcriptional regulator [Herpetosiphon giganteus]MBM7844665.1 Rrf2 family protein [Herpetosiphon giganteus]